MTTKGDTTAPSVANDGFGCHKECKEGHCEKCGLEVLGGASIWCCQYARECPMWPHSDGSPDGDGAELLMAKLWMDNACEQIDLQIKERERLERVISDERSAWQRVTGNETPEEASKTICGLQGGIVEETVRADRLAEYAVSIERAAEILLAELDAALIEDDLKTSHNQIPRAMAGLVAALAKNPAPLVETAPGLTPDGVQRKPEEAGHSVFRVEEVHEDLWGITFDGIAAPYLWSFTNQLRAENLARELNLLVAPRMGVVPSPFTDEQRDAEMLLRRMVSRHKAGRPPIKDEDWPHIERIAIRNASPLRTEVPSQGRDS